MPTFGTTPRLFGGYMVDRAEVRRLIPDARWFVYAAGWVDPKDGSTATVEIVYEKDDGSVVVLGSVTQAGAGRVKVKMGPFDVFAVAGVPGGEEIPSLRLRASKDGGVNGEVDGWCLRLRFFPALK